MLGRAFYLRTERDDAGWVHDVDSDYYRAPQLQAVDWLDMIRYAYA